MTPPPPQKKENKNKNKNKTSKKTKIRHVFTKTMKTEREILFFSLAIERLQNEVVICYKQNIPKRLTPLY